MIKKILLTLTVLVLPINIMAQASSEQETLKAIMQGDYRRAVEIAGAQLKTRPNDASLRVLLARAELAQGNFQAAYTELRRALSIEPANIDALYYLAMVSEVLAPKTYDRLYEIAPNSDRVHQLLAEAALAQDNQAEAETEYNAALISNPRSIDAILGLAELKRSQSKFDEALAIYQRGETLIGLNHDIAYGIGACFMYLQEKERAISYFRQAVNFAPDAEATHFALGNALFQNGQMKEAVGPLKRAVELNPKMKQAYFLLGRAYQRTGQNELAKAAFKRVDELTREEFSKKR